MAELLRVAEEAAAAAERLRVREAAAEAERLRAEETAAAAEQLLLEGERVQLNLGSAAAENASETRLTKQRARAEAKAKRKRVAAARAAKQEEVKREEAAAAERLRAEEAAAAEVERLRAEEGAASHDRMEATAARQHAEQKAPVVEQTEKARRRARARALHLLEMPALWQSEVTPLEAWSVTEWLRGWPSCVLDKQCDAEQAATSGKALEMPELSALWHGAVSSVDALAAPEAGPPQIALRDEGDRPPSLEVPALWQQGTAPLDSEGYVDGLSWAEDVDYLSGWPAQRQRERWQTKAHKLWLAFGRRKMKSMEPPVCAALPAPSAPAPTIIAFAPPPPLTCDACEAPLPPG